VDIYRDFYMGFNLVSTSNLQKRSADLKKILTHGDIAMIIKNPNWELLINQNKNFYESKAMEQMSLERNLIKKNEKKLLLALNIFDYKNKEKLANLPNVFYNLTKEEQRLKKGTVIYKSLIEEIIFLADIYEPEYFALGFEINSTYEKNPVYFKDFLLLYFDAYDQLKDKHSNIKIFPTFQYEELLGTMPNQPTHAPRWEIVNDFANKIDLFAISSSPSKFTKIQRKIPLNYYSQLSKITSLPIIFTGIGFEGAANNIPNVATMEEQYKFISWLFNSIVEIKVEALVWMLLEDYINQDSRNTNYYGLIQEENKSNKKSWDIWQSHLNYKKK
jgi:hypothetical protein|tara:strand:+ start:7023 stop:8015 length:993 start_codon:yes stop_codon:yes gene_type:complete